MPYRSLPNAPFPVHIWATQLEAQAEQQLRNLARLPILFHHVAVMPDVHWGLGATVGAVLATEHAVIPAAVGVDIGCGMCAARLQLSRQWLDGGDRTGRLRQRIEREIPVGHEQHVPHRVSAAAMEWAQRNLAPDRLHLPLERDLREKARLQLGTLGGGNHFIEVCGDELGRAWVLLHSGSRHIGKRIADHYIRLAAAHMQEQGLLRGLPDRNLAYLSEGEPEFWDYLDDVHWAQEYARFNREDMLRRILEQVAELAEEEGQPLPGGGHVERLVQERVDCHHNYVAVEEHFGRKVYLTRKGAVSARKGELGIIPGSMGVRSYLVEGLGNADSFHSCAHGAGRAMSRHEAKRRFNLKDLALQTGGVDCRKDKGVLDEIPGAYKDLDQVMADQADLVRVVHTLRQVLCVKGG